MKRILAGLIAVTLAACHSPPAKPKVVLTTWVHFFGCPSSTEKRLGPQHVVLIFSNGTAVVLRIDDATDEKRDALAQFIGSIDGTNIVSKCGVDS